MLNRPLKLPSGDIINLSRFVALFYNRNVSGYNLILDGYERVLVISSEDAKMLEEILAAENDFSDAMLS